MGIWGTRRRLLAATGIAVAVAAGGASIARAGGAAAHGEFVLAETTTARASVDVDRSGGPTPQHLRPETPPMLDPTARRRRSSAGTDS